MILNYVMLAIYWILIIYGGLMFFVLILSWIPNAYDIKFFRTIKTIGNWYLGMFYDRLVIGSIDFTPMVGLFFYHYLVNLIPQLWI